MAIDIVNFITLMGAVQGIFFALILFRMQGGYRVANRMLALFLLTFSVSMMGIVAYGSHWILRAPRLALVHTPFGAMLGVPFLFYMLALTRKQFRMEWWHWLLLAGPFVVVVLVLLPFYQLGLAEKTAILEASYVKLPDTWRYIFIFSNLVSFACILISYVLTLRHERVIRELYSSPLHKTLAWARQFLHAGALVFIACVIASFFDIVWADNISNLLMSGIIYVFGYRAIQQPEIFRELSADAIPDASGLSLVHTGGSKYEKSGLTEARAQSLLTELDRRMDLEKMYLDPTLNLQQLASALGIKPHQTSQLLNQYKKAGFSDFINAYRVEHFKSAIFDPANAHLSILAVAFESGFNSKAAFNAVFKKMTGLTPSGFAKQASR